MVAAGCPCARCPPRCDDLPVSSLQPRLLTVGHGTAAADALAGLLESAGTERLVDVRSFPGSRRSPQFRRDELERWVPAAGIGYRWEQRLGGRRRMAPGSPNIALRNSSFRGYADYMDSEPFRTALDELLAEALQQVTAMMCAESLWWRCHRRLIADAAVLLHDVEVRHLGHDGKLSEHQLTEGVRVAADRLVYDGS